MARKRNVQLVMYKGINVQGLVAGESYKIEIKKERKTGIYAIQATNEKGIFYGRYGSKKSVMRNWDITEEEIEKNII